MPLNLSKDELRYIRHLIWKDCLERDKQQSHLLRKIEDDLTRMKNKEKKAPKGAVKGQIISYF